MSYRDISQCICGGVGNIVVIKWENGKTNYVLHCLQCNRHTWNGHETKDFAIDEWNEFMDLMSGGEIGGDRKRERNLNNETKTCWESKK